MNGSALDLIAACPVPVKILAGTEDRVSDLALLDDLAVRFPHVAVRLVAGADHHLPLLAPEECMEAIRNCIRPGLFRADAADGA